MYNPNGQSVNSAKWFFLLAVLILLGAFALGFNLKDAQWLNPEIASATAKQVNVATGIDQEKAKLDLQVLRTQSEIQITKMKQDAEYETAKQQQELKAQTIAATQKANFQGNMYNAFAFGLKVLMIAISGALILAGIYTSVGLFKILNAKAQVIQADRPAAIVVRKRQPSLAAQIARQREREERETQLIDSRINKLFPESEPVWTATGGKVENFKPKEYPWAN
jgi:hypothetical protein